MRRAGFLLACVVIFAVVAAAQADNEQQAQAALKGGEKISMALATVTSTAISPLVGVCVMGMWQYYRTPKVQRDHLPVIQKPAFWIPVILLLLLIFLKDTFGGFAPLVKKPLDAAEVLFVNHAALVLIAFPVVLAQVSRVMGFPSWRGLLGYLFDGPVVYAATAQSSGVHHAFSIAAAAVVTVVGLTITFVVWMVGHSFDVLAMISPFPFLDFLLKATRNVLFAVLLITALLSPVLGVILSLALIVVSFLLFGWALRLSFFGSVFAWSLLRTLVMHEHVKPSPGEKVSAFTAQVSKLPRRTYGHLYLSEDGDLLFCYRRLLVGPRSTIRVGHASSFAVGQGIFSPCVIEPIESTDKHHVAFRLLPTYRGSEEGIRSCLELAQVCDLRWTKGLRSFWKFVTSGESTVSAQGAGR
jgi:hypothetical protein